MNPQSLPELLDEMWAAWLSALRGLFLTIMLPLAFATGWLARGASVALAYVERWHPVRPAIFAIGPRS